jgi:N-acetylglucosamine-6-phosphate deacetylase
MDMIQNVIDNVNVVLPDRIEDASAVIIKDDKIDKICSQEQLKKYQVSQTVDGQGGYLVPGFIDLHIHGSHEFLIDNGANDLAGLCKVLPKYGVTGFLPTVCPRPKGEDTKFLASLSEVISEGTRIYGFHLEGPFLTLTGALPKEALGSADPERVKSLIEAAKPYSAIFSVAPDFENILDLIKLMKTDNTPVFCTHTVANVKQTQMAIEAGVRHATHFYDVFHVPETKISRGVRPCGAVEAILADKRVTVDFILDGVHVDPVAVKLALVCKGPEGVCLITDANVGAGMEPGLNYKFGKTEIRFKSQGGPAYMTENTDRPGALAGSGLTMDLAVRNAKEMLGLDIPDAVRMASGSPAAVLGLDDTKGKIAEGYDADLVLLDKNLNVQQTWIGGKSVFSKS